MQKCIKSQEELIFCSIKQRMLRNIVFITFIAYVFGGKCYVNQHYENTCKIGGLVLLKQEEKIKVIDENCDAIYPKGQWETPPDVSFPKAEKGQTYTIVCIDPDAPDHPKGHYVIHWVKANIPGEDLSKGNLTNGLDIIGYIGPDPPDKSGLHRYMFLVYRHNDPKMRLQNKLNDEERLHFIFEDWISKVQNEEGALCGPEAAIQFRSQFS